VPGSFDDVVLAYDLGKLSDGEYEFPAEAVASGSPNRADARRSARLPAAAQTRAFHEPAAGLRLTRRPGAAPGVKSNIPVASAPSELKWPHPAADAVGYGEGMCCFAAMTTRTAA
jgi:hypothetical protein